MTEPNQNRTRASLRLDSLRLSNYRCFSSLDISFEHDLTVLVANNGQGKTAVLDAAATALGAFVGAFDDGKDRAFLKNDIRLLHVENSNRMELADGGVTLEASGLVDYQLGNWKRQLTGPNSRTTRKNAQPLTNAAKKLQKSVRQETESRQTGTCLPLVAYYPTDRLWNVRRLPYKKLPHTSRMVGYTHCLESGSDFHLMANWFQYWTRNALNQRLKAQQQGSGPTSTEFDDAIEVVRKATNRCLEPIGWHDMDFSLEREEIVARHPHHGELPVAMLSDGVRNMLTLVADIAFRTVKLNPNLGPFAATQTDGVVLVDEIDMHLHPSWQQTVLGSLRKAFPRIQFIVTTHSPQVLTTVPSRCIRLLQRERNPETDQLEWNAKTFEEQTQGVASATVLAEIMDTDPVPDLEQSQWLSDYKALIEQGLNDTSEAKELREKLVDHFGAHHPLLLDCDRMIRLQSFRATLQAVTRRRKDARNVHRLHRGAAPTCLSGYRHGQHRWNHVNSQEKQEIWQALDVMQHERCAYCEAPLANGRKHIEHLRQHARYPQGTFDWPICSAPATGRTAAASTRTTAAHTTIAI